MPYNTSGFIPFAVLLIVLPAGEYSPDVGRTPMAAAEPTLQQQVQQSVGYEVKEVSQPC
jgi:hypothetical protein